MSRSQREEKGGKRVKKEQRPSRRGVRRMFLTCCILAIILLALWQTGMLPLPRADVRPHPAQRHHQRGTGHVCAGQQPAGQVGRDRRRAYPGAGHPLEPHPGQPLAPPARRATSPS